MTGIAPSIFPLGASFAGRDYAVLGLARSGLATVAALIAADANVTAWDDRAEARALGSALGATIADLGATDLGNMAGLIVSPGVPIDQHPIALAARAAHVPILGDIELFAMAQSTLPQHRVIGITGTNGKSTVTALIHHLLISAGHDATLGGNIGLPILSRAPLPAGGIYVLELSSYQIDLTHSLACDIAVLTNNTPDHLDRYGGEFMAYAASKARLFTMQHADQLSVIATDDDRCRMIASHVNHRLVRVSAHDVARDDQQHWPALQGPHNAQNVACAVAVVRSVGLTDAQINSGLRSFQGLEHRMERVAEKNGVLYVNDSKATNPASSAPALAAYPPLHGRARIHWIVGGLAKGEGVGECAQWLGHVSCAYLIGDAAPMLARTLSGHVAVDKSVTLEKAVASAAAVALSDDVVLLSPAAASFDQFRDYEHRGQSFRDAVAGLSDVVGEGGI